VEVRDFFHMDPKLLPSVYYCFTYSGDPKFISRLWQSVVRFMRSYVVSVLRVMPDDKSDEDRLLSHPLIFIIHWSAFY